MCFHILMITLRKEMTSVKAGERRWVNCGNKYKLNASGSQSWRGVACAVHDQVK